MSLLRQPSKCVFEREAKLTFWANSTPKTSPLFSESLDYREMEKK